MLTKSLTRAHFLYLTSLHFKNPLWTDSKPYNISSAALKDARQVWKKLWRKSCWSGQRRGTLSSPWWMRHPYPSIKYLHLSNDCLKSCWVAAGSPTLWGYGLGFGIIYWRWRMNGSSSAELAITRIGCFLIDMAAHATVRLYYICNCSCISTPYLWIK